MIIIKLLLRTAFLKVKLDYLFLGNEIDDVVTGEVCDGEEILTNTSLSTVVLIEKSEKESR